MKSINVKSVTEFPDAPDIESSTEDYAGRFRGAIGNWLVDRQINATRRAIDNFFTGADSFSVLDVGGGHGQNIKLVNELGGKLTIVGSDDSCIRMIQREVETGQAEFVVSPLLKLPFEDNSFDLVVCYRILSHMASWQALITELCRVSRRFVLIDYPSKKSVNIFADSLFAVKKRIEKNTRQYGCFSDREIDRIFRESDNRRVFEHRQFFLPMVLYRLIGNVALATFLAKAFRISGLTDRFGSPVISGYSLEDTTEQLNL